MLAAVEGLEFGAVERAGFWKEFGELGERGERGFPFFGNAGTHANRGPVCFKLVHLFGCPCSVGIGISNPGWFVSEARCRALRDERVTE